MTVAVVSTSHDRTLGGSSRSLFGDPGAPKAPRGRFLTHAARLPFFSQIGESSRPRGSPISTTPVSHYRACVLVSLRELAYCRRPSRYCPARRRWREVDLIPSTNSRLAGALVLSPAVRPPAAIVHAVRRRKRSHLQTNALAPLLREQAGAVVAIDKAFEPAAANAFVDVSTTPRALQAARSDAARK